LSQHFKNIPAELERRVLDSWGISGTGETPQEWQRRGGSPPAPPESKRPERKLAFFPPFPNKKMTKGNEKDFSLPFDDNMKWGYPPFF